MGAASPTAASAADPGTIDPGRIIDEFPDPAQVRVDLGRES